MRGSTDLELGADAGDVEAVQRPALRLPLRGRILGVQPHLDRMTLCGRGILGEAATLCHVELERDEVETGRAFGDRVLDLQPRVHLEEEEPALVVGEELDRAGAGVVDRLRGRARGVEQRLAHPVDAFDERRRRLFDDLLVPALDRAFPLADGPHGAVLVGEDLHLDVPSGGEVGLAEHGAVAERRSRFGAGELDLARQRSEVGDDAHATSAAARARLDQHGQFGRGDLVRVEFGQHGDAGRGHEPLRLDLAAHRGDRLGRRPDPGRARPR